MARPQTKDGFVMIALDLFAAIMAADLPNRCQIVLAEALLELYGPKKADSVQLVPAAIEQFTGLHRNNARRAIRELTEWHILVSVPDGAYGFNKDYETWAVAGKPMAGRLGGGLARFAASAFTRHRIKPTHKRPAQSNGIQVVALTSIQRDSGGGTYLNPTGLTLDPLPPDPPIGEPRASEELRLKIKEGGGFAPACTHEEPEPELPPLTPEQAKRKALAEKVSKMLGDGGPEHAASIDSVIGTHSEAAVMQVAAQCIGKQSPLLYFFSIVRTTGLDKYELRPGQYRKGTPLPTKPASLAAYTAPAASVDDPSAEHWRTLPEATQARYEAAERTRDKAANKYIVKARAMEAAFRARGRVETCSDGATMTAT
jgi:hypothetical protein